MSESALKFAPYRAKMPTAAECIKRLSFGSTSPRDSMTSLSYATASDVRASNMSAIVHSVAGTFAESVPVSAVQVCLRIKPTEARPETLQMLDETRIKATPPPGAAPTFKMTEYTFSRVFGPQTKQQEVFENVAGRLVSTFLDHGKDGLVFAYGVTNSGKTFTVEGNKENPGIIPLSLQRIFSSNPKDAIHVSYLQIYNDQVHDLQEPPAPTPQDPFNLTRRNLKLKLRDEGVIVEGLKETRVTSLEEAMTILEKGRENRNTNDNSINHSSSRSHTVFIIRIGQARLHIVDLAGSERSKRTKATGVRQLEASNINLSLSQLMQCLDAMRANQKLARLYPDKPRDRPPFRPIPFRDCKLTMLFRDCLRGKNCAGVCMIVNASPDPADFEETCQALRYGELTRSTAIESNPVTANPLLVAASRYDYNGRLIRAPILPEPPSIVQAQNPSDGSLQLSGDTFINSSAFDYDHESSRVSRRSLRNSISPKDVVPTAIPASLLPTSSSKKLSFTENDEPNRVSVSKVDLIEENSRLKIEVEQLRVTLEQQEVALREELAQEMAQALEEMRMRYEARVEWVQQNGSEMLQQSTMNHRTTAKKQPTFEELKMLSNMVDECEAEMERMREQHQRDIEALQAELNHARRAQIEATMQQQSYQQAKPVPGTPWMVAEERKRVDRALRALEVEKDAHKRTQLESEGLKQALERFTKGRKGSPEATNAEVALLKEQLEVAKQTITKQERWLQQVRAQGSSPKPFTAELAGVAPHLLLSKKKPTNKENQPSLVPFRSRENMPKFGSVAL